MLEPSGDASRGVYAAIWSGGVGRLEGSHTRETQIAIVHDNGFGTAFVVDPGLSSPQVEFGAPLLDVDRLVRNTQDTLVLESVVEGRGGATDPACCIDLRVRFAMRLGSNGRWTLAWQRVMGPARGVRPRR